MIALGGENCCEVLHGWIIIIPDGTVKGEILPSSSVGTRHSSIDSFSPRLAAVGRGPG